MLKAEQRKYKITHLHLSSTTFTESWLSEDYSNLTVSMRPTHLVSDVLNILLPRFAPSCRPLVACAHPSRAGPHICTQTMLQGRGNGEKHWLRATKMRWLRDMHGTLLIRAVSRRLSLCLTACQRRGVRVQHPSVQPCAPQLSFSSASSHQLCCQHMGP
jgi:hypothetical protein